MGRQPVVAFHMEAPLRHDRVQPEENHYPGYVEGYHDGSVPRYLRSYRRSLIIQFSASRRCAGTMSITVLSQELLRCVSAKTLMVVQWLSL